LIRLMLAFAFGLDLWKEMLKALVLHELVVSISADAIGTLLMRRVMAGVFYFLNWFLGNSKAIDALCLWAMVAVSLLHFFICEGLVVLVGSSCRILSNLFRRWRWCVDHLSLSLFLLFLLRFWLRRCSTRNDTSCIHSILVCNVNDISIPNKAFNTDMNNYLIPREPRAAESGAAIFLVKRSSK
jgi:hypothetical protein